MKIIKFLKPLLPWCALVLLSIQPSAIPAEVNGSLSENLRQALEAQGWRAEQAQDGSLIYRQPVDPPTQQQTRPAARAPQREVLQDALQQRGWSLHWGPDGNLILRPQGQTGRTPAHTGSAPAGRPLEQLPDLPGFEYWRITKQHDGSWNFQPLNQAPAAVSSGNTTAPGRCEGVAVSQAAVALPVDEWAEAKTLAQAWLQQAGLHGRSVGRIRRVLGIYLVSLVADTAPHYLLHQLAIRASDGRVMLLE